MKELHIKNCKVITPGGILEDHCVCCREGKIADIAPQQTCGCAEGDNIVDANGGYLAPGFIDLHIHGILGECLDDGVRSLQKVTAALPQFGVTGFLPTIAPRAAGEDARYLSSLAAAETKGTQVLGFHLEGPFLSFTGALPPEAIGKADKKRVLDLIEATKPYPAIFSISPDFKDIETIIPLMKANAPAVFMTHTAANVEQTLRAIELGACHATHFYDVFYAPKESDPGVRPCGAVEAILADRQVSVDFILDGEHVDPVAVKMAIACKGSEKVCLISDASPGGGAKPGVYDFVGTKVKISYPGGPARMVSGNSLAGSGLTMDIAVKNAIKLLGLDIAAAVKMASTNPAKVLKIENQKGQIMKGCDADLVLLDKDMNVQKTWVNGICEYEKPQLSSQA